VVSCNGGLVRQINNQEVFDGVVERLEILKSSIAKDGFNLPYDVPILVQLYGKFDSQHWQPDLYASYVGLVAMACLPDDIRKQGGGSSAEECKNWFLEKLDEEIERILLNQIDQEAMESERMKLESLRLSVLVSPRLDPYLRCSAELQRTLDKALSQLERLQRMRLGQPIAPRIDVNFSRS
jgi:hypothetical protein